MSLNYDFSAIVSNYQRHELAESHDESRVIYCNYSQLQPRVSTSLGRVHRKICHTSPVCPVVNYAYEVMGRDGNVLAVNMQRTREVNRQAVRPLVPSTFPKKHFGVGFHRTVPEA
ncbi:nuclear receptor corepressor 2-like [Moniliophthora roreri]|nr:nuclear receptor corepressor 2-like [Moniliophthora roreri]